MLIRFCFQGLQDIPALFPRCFSDGSKRAEIFGTFLGSETPRDLLSDFRHSQVPVQSRYS